MSRVIAVVEGQTEQDFVRDLLSPWLAAKGVYIFPRLVGKPGHKGGVGEYERARRDILLLLKQEQGTTITTMYDFYGMPDSWPGRSQAKTVALQDKPKIVERAIKEDIASRMGPSFDDQRIHPYVQMHEFEALLFSRPATICETLLSLESEPVILAIRKTFSTPEDIDDNPETAPSKRLLRVFPGYQKRLHGLIAVKRMGIDPLLSECPHFSQWIHTMRGLGEVQTQAQKGE